MAKYKVVSRVQLEVRHYYRDNTTWLEPMYRSWPDGVFPILSICDIPWRDIPSHTKSGECVHIRNGLTINDFEIQYV